MDAPARQHISDLRHPPHSVYSEQAVLGGLLLDNASWPAASDVLVAADFYRHDHQLIFHAISDLLANGEPADAVTVSEVLASKDLSRHTGGLAYLTQLVTDTPSAANVGAYAAIIRERSTLRSLIGVGEQLSANGYDPEGRTAAELLADAERRVLEIGRSGKKAAEPRHPMQWEALAELTPPIRKWSVSHWLTDGPTLFAGAGGIGKTLVAQTLATALAVRARYLDDIHERQAVLFWACEDDHNELWRRQVQICAYLGVDMRELAGWLILEPRFGRDNTLFDTAYGSPKWTPLRDELKSQVHDTGAAVLFLDNIGQTYGADENKRHHVTKFVNGLAGMVTEHPFSVVIMGHPAKSAESEFAGNAAWENAVRMRWFMGAKLPDQKIEEGEELDPNVRYISKRKTNYSTKDYRKLIYTNGVFVPEEAQHGAFQMRFGNREGDAEACVITALQRFADANVRVTGGHSSPDYLIKKMRQTKLAGDYSENELRNALSRLILAQRVHEAPFGNYGNRGTRMGLVVKP